MAHLSGTALAAAAGWHGPSKVSKIEHGTRPASADDVRIWCRVCGVSPERTEELLAEQRAAAGLWTSYQRLNRAGLRAAQESVRPIYERAHLLRSYQTKILPGLLQTADYTSTILATARDRQGVRQDDLSEAVAERLARQHVLRRAGHRFMFVIEEAVLRHRVCEPRVLREQIDHLLAVMRLPTVAIGVIPLAKDRQRVLPREAFTVFDDELVAVELVSGVLSIRQPNEIAMYARDFADLARIAVWNSAARSLIEEAHRAID